MRIWCTFKCVLTKDRLAVTLDSPIKEEKNDLLGSTELINSIKKMLLNLDVSKSAAAIGISGEWGSGKTSILNLLRKSLDEYRLIQFNFSPWQYNMNTDYANVFLKELEKQLSAGNINLHNLSKYRNALEQSGDNRLRIVLTLCDFFFPTDINTTMEKVKAKMRKLPFKVVVYIDDLDRLQKEEILSILRLVKNQSDFPNLIFVVTYDQSYVLKQLGNEGASVNSSYLDKIFFPVFNLPPQKENVMAGALRDTLYPLFENHADDRKELYNLIDNVIKNESLQHTLHIDSLRSAKRIASIFRIKYGRLQGEVNALDLYYLCVIEARWPLFYNLIVQKLPNFSPTKGNSNKLFVKIRKDEQGSDTPSKKDEDSNFDLIQYVTINHLKYLISENSLNEVVTILDLLFPKYLDHDYKQKSISDYSYLYRYFYSLASYDISYVDFKEIIVLKGDKLVDELQGVKKMKKDASFLDILNENIYMRDPETYLMIKMNAICVFNTNLFALFSVNNIIDEIDYYIKKGKTTKQKVYDIINGCIPSIPILLILKELVLDGSFNTEKVQKDFLSKLKLYLPTIENAAECKNKKGELIKLIVDNLTSSKSKSSASETLINESLKLLLEFSSHNIEDHIDLFYTKSGTFNAPKYELSKESFEIWKSGNNVINFIKCQNDVGKPKIAKLKEFLELYIQENLDGNSKAVPFDFI